MRLKDLSARIPPDLLKVLSSEISELRPAQEKAIKAGLLEGNNILVCTPTSSGKTLIAELAMVTEILRSKAKAIYIVPLKALANEKYNDFRKRYGGFLKVALSIGDLDASDSYLIDYDIIITVSEKLDSLIRHYSPWISMVRVVVIDEIHLLNDSDRGPTLEILITILRQLLKDVQIVALSATIGNPDELAEWLGAVLVQDSWRPVPLKKGVYLAGEIEFY
ncbi:DEAD/DEAH box helicase [Candidatus Woesearchaeota archaeon]|nr:DEAD/DEAH box helicase [Candidatus Woesearchaeota archaeon]